MYISVNQSFTSRPKNTQKHRVCTVYICWLLFVVFFTVLQKKSKCYYPIVFTFQWPIELESLLKFINVLEILSLLYHHLCNNWKSDIDSQILFARLIKHSIFEIVWQLSDREWIINWNTIPAFGGGGNVCKWKIKFL